MERCPDCGGFVDGGSCVCALSDELRSKLAQAFKITEDEVVQALLEGRLYLISSTHSSPDEGIAVQETEIKYTLHAKRNHG